MSSPELDKVATDVDDASDLVEELQDELDEDTPERLDALHQLLDHASDMIDELEHKDE